MRYNHAFMDCAARLRREHAVTPEAIDTILHADVIKLEGLFERYASELRHRMPRRREDDQTVGTVWKELEAGRRHRGPEYADVDDAVAHGTHNVRAKVLFEVDTDSRVAREEGR